MQEESAVTLPDRKPAWSCPLCQQEQSARDALAHHLTLRHNVLPACLERLLNTATLVHCVEEVKAEEIADAQHKDLGISENEAVLNETVHDTATSLQSKESRVKLEDDKGWVQEDKKEGLKQEEMIELPESSEPQKNSLDKYGTIRKSITFSDLKETDFLDPKKPFKCTVCLESFSSKSRLTIHYGSAGHLCRMRREMSVQGKESDFSTVNSCPKSDQSLPYISSKPYQCAVCRVSYNHSITLESHLRSVLHQSRCRSAGSSAGGAVEVSGSKSNNLRSNTPALRGVTGSGSDGLRSEGVAIGHVGAYVDSSASTTVSPFDSRTTQILAPADHTLSPPIASTEAASAFLSLLTSGSQVLSPSIVPSVLATSSTSSPITTLPQIISQQQLLLPLFLNSVHTQNQNPNPDAPGHVLTQPVPMLGLSAAQQVLLAQKACVLQNQGPGFSSALSASSKKKQSKAGGSPEGVRESVEEEEVIGVKTEANTSPKHTVKEEEGDVKEWTKKGNCTVLTSTLKCKRGSSNSDVDGDTTKERRREVGGENTEENECRGQNRVKEWEKDEGKRRKPGNTFHQNPLTFQAALDKIPPETSVLPCSVSGPSYNSLSPMSPVFSQSIDATLQESPTTTSSHLSPTNSTILIIDDVKDDVKAHVQSSSLISEVPLMPLENHTPTGTDFRSLHTNHSPFKLTEFQSQMLWAFFESRSETDIASPSQDDVDALCKEVGLVEEQVRRWLSDAQERPNYMGAKLAASKVVLNAREICLDGATGKLMAEKKSDYRLFIDGKCPITRNHAVDLSNNGEQYAEEHRGSCQASDADSGEFCTAVLTGKETQNGVACDGQDKSSKAGRQVEGMVTEGGKVLRSSTVFLSDAEDENEHQQSTNTTASKKRKKLAEGEEVSHKRDKLGPDVNLELDAQTDSPPSPSVEHGNFFRSAVCSSAPLSFAPVRTQFVNPYILPISPFPVGLQISKSCVQPNKGKPHVLLSPLPALPFSCPLNMQVSAQHTPSSGSLSGQDDCESALDLSVRKNYSSKLASSTATSANDKAVSQQNQLLEGLGLKPTGAAVPGTGGLILLHVKPNSTAGLHSSSNAGNKTKRSCKQGEQVNTSRQVKGKGIEHEDKDHESTKLKRLRARSRTIIQTEQLDVLYGCYFKDPNPGKHEFEQISEWVNLPKKVVQIWFQNMRARERKGEVRFIGNGTLAAVGKPLINFTWPLSQPIFCDSKKANLESPGGNKPSRRTAKVTSVDTRSKTPPVTKIEKEEKESLGNAKSETETPCSKTKTTTEVSGASATVTLDETHPPHLPQKRKLDQEDQLDDEADDKTDEEDEPDSHVTGSGSTNPMVPKVSLGKTVVSEPPKHNGLNYWPTKAPFKINTFTREQLVLSGLGKKSTTISTSPEVASSPRTQGNNNLQQCMPRRPRTLLTNLQLSILQSCYEMCPHPNAVECEAVGTELKLPLKVIQIWFQNTRAKEKRWRLQQEKQSSSAADCPEKVDTSPSSYLQYSALRANRPILPKPVHLTVLEHCASPAPGQPAGQETVKGKCEVCGVEFESRAAGRVHVFSSQHLAMLRATNFGQLPSIVSNSSGARPVSGSGTGIETASSSASPNSETS